MKLEAASQLRPFLDHMGEALESMGMPAMVGKVMGWLAVCEPPCQQASEVACALGVAPVTVLPALEALEAYGVLDGVVTPDDTVCYALKSTHDLVARRVGQITDLRRALAEGLALLPAEDAAARSRLEELHGLYGVLERELPEVMARWSQRRPAR